MKKITLLFALMAVSFGFSQQVLIEDFESGSALDAGFSGIASSSVVADPGDGSRGQVARLEVVAGAGDPWQGANVNFTNNIDLTTDKTIKMDVYSVDPIDILVKVDNGLSGAPASAVEVQHPGGSVWIQKTVSFTTPRDNTTQSANGVYPLIAVFPNWDHTTPPGSFSNPPVAGVVYFDNIYAVPATAPTCSDGVQNGDETGVDCGGSSCAPCAPTCTDGIQNGDEEGIDCGGSSCAPCTGGPTSPTVAAPTPPARDPEDVISIYSDFYTNPLSLVAYDNFDAGWCGGPGVTPVMIAGDNALKKNGTVVCHGIDFQSDRQDLTGFTHVHFDVFLGDDDLVGDVFDFKVVDFGFGAGENSNFAININGGTTPQLVAGEWISVDIELATTGNPPLSGSLTRTDVAQIGITTPNLTDVWYDNIYFYKNPSLSTEEVSTDAFKIYPNPSSDSWTVSNTNSLIQTIDVVDILGKKVISLSPNNNKAIINASNLKAGLYFAQVKTVSGISSLKLIKK